MYNFYNNSYIIMISDTDFCWFIISTAMLRQMSDN